MKQTNGCEYDGEYGVISYEVPSLCETVMPFFVQNPQRDCGTANQWFVQLNISS